MPIPLIERALEHLERVAVAAMGGDYSYRQLLQDSHRVATCLLGDLSDLAGERVAFLVSPTHEYPVAQWGVWRAGGIAVPLCLAHPEPEFEYVIEDIKLP